MNMRKIIDTVKFFTDKQFSTIAGTLVYFLLMSIAPFTLWLTLVLGNFSLHVERFMSRELFDSISPFLSYMKSSAESAASGAGIILLITTVYSSTNFFYHLRRSGEIIYNSSRRKEGLKLRVVSLLLIFGTFFLAAVIAAIAFLGTWFLEKFLPFYIADIISYTFLTALAFAAAMLLNLFACPYKLKGEEVVCGSLLTTALWLLCLVGFTVYLQFADPEKLYGKIASLIIFLLWCYVMMSCFVIGVIYNGSFKRRNVYKKLF
ncbi:MAG: YihY/virulence factor BrkB family protein [Clostridia bacterium]|nr:YihY/virulence factor BrkB family protein [Clostridia bacterium]